MNQSQQTAIDRSESFKETEIGILPVSWTIKSLGELFEVQQGKALSQKARTGISPRPFLRTINVLWGKVDLTTIDQMDFTEEEVQRLALKPGDLLICEGGEIGRSAVWGRPDEGICYQNHVHRLRRKNDGIAPDFVMYWMQAAFLLLRLYGGVGNKTTIPNLSGNRLKQLLIPVPPLPEQRAIATVLAKIHAVVEVQDKIVATLKELKAATMAKLFREGLHGEPLKQTEIGEMPESWEVMRVGDLVKLCSGASRPDDLSTECTEKTSFPVYGGNGVMGYSGQFLTAQESIVIGRVGAYCGSIHVCPAHSWVTDNALYHRDPVSDKVTLHFLAELLSYLKLNRLQRKGAQPLVTQGTVHNVVIPLPSKPEQEEIARTATLLNRQIETAAQKLSILKLIFSSMLHLLMTGRVRINLQTSMREATMTKIRSGDKTGNPGMTRGLPEDVERFASELTKRFKPDRVILFGSYAEGSTTPESDVDLLVVMNFSGRARDQAARIDSELERNFPLDLLIRRPVDVKKALEIGDPFMKEIVEKGRVLYARHE